MTDRYKNIYLYVCIITIVIITYTIYSEWVKYTNIIDKKYFSSKGFSWQSNIIIITFSLIFQSGISSYFPNQSENQNRLQLKESQMDLLTNIMSVSVTPAIIEEICFRGIICVIIFISSCYLMKLNRNYKYLAIITFLLFSSALFGFLHVAKSYDFQNIGAYLVSGITFSFVFIITRDIKIPIIIHALGNLFGVLYRNDLQYISVLIVIVLFSVTGYCIKKKFNVVDNYGSYLEYKFKKARARKILKKDAEKCSEFN